MTGDQDAAAGGSRAHEAVGSAAEEALRLLGALTDWAHQVDDGVREGLEEHLATGAPECTWCPVCRTVHVVRAAASPEVLGHLASAAASLMQAAAGVLAAAAAGPGQQAARSDRVETIDLDGSEGWPVEEEHERPEEDA